MEFARLCVLLLFAVVVASHGSYVEEEEEEEEEDWMQRSCRLTPNEENPTSAVCDLKGQWANIKVNDIPRTIQTLHLHNSSRIQVFEDALTSLEQLKSITFADMKYLVVQKSDMTNHNQISNRSLIIKRMKYVSLRSGAFSGWKNLNSRISISNVDELHMNKSALAPSSNIKEVLLENISSLTINEQAFRASLGELVLKNVTMNVCYRENLSGAIESLSLIAVTLNSTLGQCLRVPDDYAIQSLTIRSSTMRRIASNGFHGNIDNVVIEDSRMASVETSGFHLKTRGFSLKSCVVDDLAEDALDVQASQSISLQQINVTTLQAHAFRRLKVLDNTGGGINLSDLLVMHVHDGSLNFSDEDAVNLREIQLNDTCQCDIQSRAQRLVRGQQIDPTPAESSPLLQQVFGAVRCRYGMSTPSFAEYRCGHCPGHADTDVWCRVAQEARDHLSPSPPVSPSWVPYAAGAAALLLLTGAALLLVLRRRRVARQRLSSRLKRQPVSKSGPESDVLHDTRRPEEARKEGGPATAASGAAFDQDYCEVQLPIVGSPSERGSAVYAEVLYHTTATAVPGPQASPDEEQPLYEEIPEHEPTAAAQAASQHETPETKGARFWPATALYAVSGPELPAAEPVLPPQDRPAADLPEYATVSKNTPADLPEYATVSENTPAEFPECAEVSKNTPTNLPEYAKVSKKVPTKFPEYATVSKNAPTAFPEYATVSKNTPTDLPEYATVSKNTPTEFPEYAEVSRSTAPEPPEYAEVSRDAAGRVAPERMCQTLGLVDNALYGSTV